MKFALIATIATASAITMQDVAAGSFAGQHYCSNGDMQRTFYPGEKGFISNSAIHASCIDESGDAVDVQLDDQLLAQLSNTLSSAQRSEARGDGDAAVAKTAAIKNI